MNMFGCEKCFYWQNFKDRVFAVISNARSNTARNLIELRRCGFTMPPQSSDNKTIYTDKDYFCGGFRGLPEKD